MYHPDKNKRTQGANKIQEQKKDNTVYTTNKIQTDQTAAVEWLAVKNPGF